MKRPRQHVMEDASIKLFHGLLPDEWVIRPIAKDYGVDFEVELVDQEIVSGDRIWVQLKSTEEAKKAVARWPVADRFPDVPSDGNGNIAAECIPYSMEMKEIDYAQRCHFPLLLDLDWVRICAVCYRLDYLLAWRSQRSAAAALRAHLSWIRGLANQPGGWLRFDLGPRAL
ncbi:DUF4365 domain-containing protein [Bradyrhizobium oligotrophicum]|uniref:DUF4365 domain-containing protein n=1 Tax=Bradyrhizobium oligotrophicum TaxID=44255 RepID=UPI003EC00A0C